MSPPRCILRPNGEPVGVPARDCCADCDAMRSLPYLFRIPTMSRVMMSRSLISSDERR